MAAAAVGTPSTRAGVSRCASVASASSVASSSCSDPRRRGMPPLDVLQHQRHPLAVVVEPEESCGRDVGGELPADRRLGAVDAGSVRVLRRADGLDERGSAGCRRQPVGRARGVPTGLRPGRHHRRPEDLLHATPHPARQPLPPQPVATPRPSPDGPAGARAAPRCRGHAEGRTGGWVRGEVAAAEQSGDRGEQLAEGQAAHEARDHHRQPPVGQHREGRLVRVRASHPPRPQRLDEHPARPGSRRPRSAAPPPGRASQA